MPPAAAEAGPDAGAALVATVVGAGVAPVEQAETIAAIASRRMRRDWSYIARYPARISPSCLGCTSRPQADLAQFAKLRDGCNPNCVWYFYRESRLVIHFR